jgi:hypothetical protein
MLLVLFLILSFNALSALPALGVTVQKPGLAVPVEYIPNRALVEQIFDTSYEAYRWVKDVCTIMFLLTAPQENTPLDMTTCAP